MIDSEDQGTIRSEAEAPQKPIYVTDLAQDRDDFEPVNNPKKPIKWIVFMIAVCLFILGIVLVLRTIITAREKAAEPTPTPIMFVTPVPTNTPTPEISIEKKIFKVKVFNGTGIVGEAKFLKDKLTDLGFETIDTGNASTTDYTATQIYVKTTVPEVLKNELLKQMSSLYGEAEIDSKAPSGQYDIEIVTGLRPGVAPPTRKPTTKPTISGTIPTSAVSSTTTPTRSSSPSTTPSTTPTKTTTPSPTP